MHAVVGVVLSIGSDRIGLGLFSILYYSHHWMKKVKNTSTLYHRIIGSNWNRKLVPKAYARFQFLFRSDPYFSRNRPKEALRLVFTQENKHRIGSEQNRTRAWAFGTTFLFQFETMILSQRVEAFSTFLVQSVRTSQDEGKSSIPNPDTKPNQYPFKIAHIRGEGGDAFRKRIC